MIDHSPKIEVELELTRFRGALQAFDGGCAHAENKIGLRA